MSTLLLFTLRNIGFWKQLLIVTSSFGKIIFALFLCGRCLCGVLHVSSFFQAAIPTIENKLAQAENEVSQLRSNLRQYETLVDEYRSQVQHTFSVLSEHTSEQSLYGPSFVFREEKL